MAIHKLYNIVCNCIIGNHCYLCRWWGLQ